MGDGSSIYYVVHASGGDKLDLSFRGLSKIPDEICAFKDLKELNLSYNQITFVNPLIGKLTSLEKLVLANNRVAQLPPEIGKLESLTELNLYHNQVLFIRRSVDPKLSSLPSEIGQLTSLKELLLSENQLVSLPKEIGCLKALEGIIEGMHELTASGLDIESNHVTALPKEVGQMTSLKWLLADYNNISTLPEQIGDLKQIERLFVDFNNVVTIPQQVQWMDSLKFLWVENNPLMYPTSDDFEITTYKIPSLTALCCKLIIDNSLDQQRVKIPEEVTQLLQDGSAKCSFCKKFYLEPAVQVMGYITLLWYEALPVQYSLCSFKCAKDMFFTNVGKV